MSVAKYIWEKTLNFSQKSLSVSLPRVVTISPQKGWIFRRTDFTMPFEIHLNRQPAHSWTRLLRTPAGVFEPQSRQTHMIVKAALEHWPPDDTEYAPDQDCYEEYSPPPGQSSYSQMQSNLPISGNLSPRNVLHKFIDLFFHCRRVQRYIIASATHLYCHPVP